MEVTRTPEQARAARLRAVNELHDKRIASGLCKYDNRENGGEPHAAPTRNRRRTDGAFTMCDPCYDAKLARKRRR